MRAYTSLTGHLLGSHPQINGYYEMHLGYEDAAALDRQLDAITGTSIPSGEGVATEEEARLLYVAMTRATEELLVLESEAA